MLSKHHFRILSWEGSRTTGRYSNLNFTVLAWDASFEKAVHEPIALRSSIQIIGRFSSKILFPIALSSTQAISLSSERLINSTLANSSLKFGILGGDPLLSGKWNSPKSLSTSSSEIYPFSGYSVLLLLSSDLTWNIVSIVWSAVIVCCFLSELSNVMWIC